METVIPNSLLIGEKISSSTGGNVVVGGMNIKDLMSKSTSAVLEPGLRVAEVRLTSVAQRMIRNTKRDVEEMHHILQRKKRAEFSKRQQDFQQAKNMDKNRINTRGPTPTTSPSKPMTPAQINNYNMGGGGGGGGGEDHSIGMTVPGTSSISMKKTVKRPPTPDFTKTDRGEKHQDNQPVYAAILLLQRLIRGRAIQNVMYEGRYRRRELIAELRRSEETNPSLVSRSAARMATEAETLRTTKIKETVLDSVAGGVTSNLFSLLADEQVSVLFCFLFICIKFLFYLDSFLPVRLIKYSSLK